MPVNVRVFALKLSQDGGVSPCLQGGRVGQAGAVHIRESACGNLICPGSILCHRLIGNGRRHDGQIVDGIDRELNGIRGRERAVAGRDLQLQGSVEILRRGASESARGGVEREDQLGRVDPEASDAV